MTIKKIRNNDSSFTELFSLLKRYERLQMGLTELAYETDEQSIIKQHVHNAIDTLLQGLQDVGQLIGIAGQTKEKVIEDLNQIGFFISAISNLTEALNILRSDADYVLKQRGMMNC